MTRILNDLTQLDRLVVPLLREFFPAAEFESKHEPVLSHYSFGALLGGKACAMCISLPTELILSYKKRVETVREAARIVHEKMLHRLETPNTKRIVFIDYDTALKIQQATPKARKSDARNNKTANG